MPDIADATLAHSDAEARAPLHYEAPPRGGTWQLVVRVAALAVYGAAVVGVALMMTDLRTWDWGTSPRLIAGSLFVSAVLLIVPGTIAFTLAPTRRWKLAVALALLAPTLAAETWAGVEEAAILARHGRTPAAAVWGARAWPFETSHWGYEPGVGWYGGD